MLKNHKLTACYVHNMHVTELAKTCIIHISNLITLVSHKSTYNDQYM